MPFPLHHPSSGKLPSHQDSLSLPLFPPPFQMFRYFKILLFLLLETTGSFADLELFYPMNVCRTPRQSYSMSHGFYCCEEMP